MQKLGRPCSRGCSAAKYVAKLASLFSGGKRVKPKGVKAYLTGYLKTKKFDFLILEIDFEILFTASNYYIL
jgi:hypothetical protein